MSTAVEMKRRGGHKKGLDATDSRRRRSEVTVSLRRQKKEEGLAKRRNTALAARADPAVPATTQGTQKRYTVQDLPALTAGLTSPDPSTQTDCARGFRRLLSVEQSPPVEEVIASGAMPALVASLSRHDNKDLQFEAAWALTNIASTDRTRVVVEHGAVPPLVQNLRHQDADLREQCAWCLGNIAGDSTELRDGLLETDALGGLLLNVAQPASDSLLRNVVWALSNFCRGKPQPNKEAIAPLRPALLQLLSSTDRDVLVDTCWALSYLSDGDQERIQLVMEGGVVPLLCRHLTHETSHVVTPALRTLGNFATGSDEQTQAVVDAGVVPLLAKLLTHTKKSIRKEACWMLSNLAAGTPEQLAAICGQPGLLASVVALFDASEWDVRKEANHVLSNVLTSCDRTQVDKLVKMGVFKPMCDMLDKSDARAVLVTMEAIEAILRLDDESERYASLFDEAEGVDRLEQLQEHENAQVYQKAVSILEGFFEGEEEGDAENLAPEEEENGQAFAFGAPSGKPQLSALGPSAVFNFQ